MSSDPRTLDGYTLVRELGRGGMGVVYEVHDPSLQRNLALKLMRASEIDEEACARFTREGELLARVNHPNVLRIHKVGRSSAGPYFVAERVEGSPLDGLLKRQGAFPPEQAAALVRDLAGAVAALHQVGVIHRDLKPGNVILRPDGTPVLIDFGLARDPQGDRLTLSGTLLGTPNYMSPEQALGENSQVGTPSDVYALGAILYALLNGLDPFAGQPTLVVLDAITRIGPTWPVEVREATPARLLAISQRAMSMKAAGRPDAAGLQAELNAFLSGAPVKRSVRGALLAGGGALLLTSIIALGAAFYAPRVGPAPGGPASPGPASPSPTASPVDVASAVEVRELTRDLRRDPSRSNLARARELLSRPGAGDYVALRRRYVEACLSQTSIFRSEGVELPALGLVRWFDDERLVVNSRNVSALWRWRSCRADDWVKVDFAGGIISRNSHPVVLGGQVFIGGGKAGARGARAYSWVGQTPERIFPTDSEVASLAAVQTPSGQSILAVGTCGSPTERVGTILLFELPSGREIGRLRAHWAGVRQTEAHSLGRQTTAEVRSLCFSPDGKWLVSGGYGGSVVVWDVAQGKLLKTSKLAGGLIQDIAFHPTKPLIVVCPGYTQAARVLEVPSLNERYTLPDHTGHSAGACFSRDGRLLFSIGREIGKVEDARAGELLAFDCEDRVLLATRPFVLQAPNALALSPDGRRLAIYSKGKGRVGILQAWEIDVPPAK